LTISFTLFSTFLCIDIHILSIARTIQ
jgi:hypothetical protein